MHLILLLALDLEELYVLTTKNYTKKSLMSRQVAAVMNFPSKQIGKFMSEILVLGFPDSSGEVVLISLDKTVPNGGRLF